MLKYILSAALISICPFTLAMAGQSKNSDSAQNCPPSEQRAGISGSQNSSLGLNDDQAELMTSEEVEISDIGSASDQVDVEQAGVADQTDSSMLSSSGQAGTSGEDQSGQSTAEASDMTRGLGGELVGIKPQVGVINYRDTFGNVGNRGIVGFTTDMNAAGLLSRMTGMGGGMAGNVFLGPSTGLFYSHIGSGNANFLGSSPDLGASGSPGTNMFMVPINLKAGYSFGKFRPSIHGGGNLIYRSVANSFALGKDPNQSSRGATSLMPNLGLDLEYGVTNAVAVVLRPDVTFGGSNPVWTTSLGASIPLG